jgi:sugar/nucleoside kinase (ribokinase family)
MLKSDVICIGSAVVDHFLETKEKFKEIRLGDKVLVNNLETHSGGGATNSAAALAKMGLKVKMLTKLGHDKEAEFILDEMKQYRVKNLCIHRSKKSTNFSAIISSEKEKDRVIYAYKGASTDLSITDFKLSQLNAKWIYLATLMGKSFQTSKKIAEYTKKKKISLLFNPSLYLAKKGKTQLKGILQATSLLILNKEEAQALLNTKINEPKKLLALLKKLGLKTVIITNGPKTIYATHNDKFYTTTPPKVKVIHTAGAGDAFNSGVLAGIIKKLPFTESLKLGLVNSASVVQHLGTKNKLLNLKESQQLIKKYKIKIIEKNV